MRITNPSQFFEGDSVVLRIRNLRNKFSSRDLALNELNAVIQSYDENDYTINTSTITLSVTQLSPNGKAQVISAQRSELAIQKSTTVEFEVQTETKLLSQSIMKIHASAFLFETEASHKLACSIFGKT